VKGLEISTLVAASRLSRWQLEDRFRRAVGRSIQDDILHVRLGEARRLITTTDLSVKQIAPRSGFGVFLDGVRSGKRETRTRLRRRRSNAGVVWCR
jgi:transcriptional regulator GlxA family with amidase domain